MPRAAAISAHRSVLRCLEIPFLFQCKDLPCRQIPWPSFSKSGETVLSCRNRKSPHLFISYTSSPAPGLPIRHTGKCQNSHFSSKEFFWTIFPGTKREIRRVECSHKDNLYFSAFSPCIEVAIFYKWAALFTNSFDRDANPQGVLGLRGTRYPHSGTFQAYFLSKGLGG